MGVFDELASTPPSALGQSGYSFIDADTLIDKDKNKYRIQGIDAPEVEKVLPDGTYKPGTAGGQAYTEATMRLANDLGYTNVKPILDEDGNPAYDTGGDRMLVDLVHTETGESFRNRAISEGIYDPTRFSDNSQILASELGQLERERNTLEGNIEGDDWDIAREKVVSAELAEGAKQQGFRIQAMDEIELAAAKAAGLGYRYSENNVQHRDKYNRTLDNRSLNPLSDSWEKGWLGVQESAYGALNLLGEETGWNELADIGTAGAERAQSSMQEYANTLTNYEDVDSFWDAMEFISNNAAMSLPYMAVTAGGAAVGAVAAPVIGGTAAVGLGVSAPAAVYAGQTWNEMEGENKNAKIAIGAGIAQATLDRIGLGSIAGKGLGGRELFKKGVDALVAKGMTKKAAEEMVANASRKELASFLGDAAKVAKEQIEAKKVFKETLSRFAVGAGSEAVTEMGQELIGYVAAHNTGEGFNFSDLNNRLINAAVAGGTLGGVFTTPGSVYDTAAWTDIAVRSGEADLTKASTGELYAQQEKDQFGRVMSVEEIAADARARAASAPGLTLDDRASAYKSKQHTKSLMDKAIEKGLNVSSLWQGATRNIFTPDLQARSRAARQLADMFGGNLQRIYSGSNFENAKHHRVSMYKNMVDDPHAILSRLSRGKRLTTGRRDQISSTLYAKLNGAVNQDGDFDPNAIPDTDPDKQMIVRLANQMNDMSNRMYADQKKHNPELGYIKNYLFKYKTLDKRAVKDNAPQFKQLLQSEYKYSTAEANALVDEILHNNEANDIDEAFSVIKGGIVPASHQKRSLGMSENKKFQDFMQKDLFANMAQAAKSAARYTAHRDYIGKNGNVIAKLLDDMQAEGIPQEEVNKVAARMQDYLDAESGNYKRPSSELGKAAQTMQRNFMMLTTLSGLPLATVSSFVELMLVNRGLTQDQVFGKKGSLEATGKELANTLWDGAKEIGGFAARREFGGGDVFDTNRQELLRDLGYYDWDVGAATVTGVTEVNAWQQRVYENFFKATGLQGWTNYTRAVRASLAGDYITDKVDLLHNMRNQPRTREVQEAQEALRNLGIDVDRMVEVSTKMRAGLPLSQDEQAFMDNSMREASFNFVNDAIALPQSANRPLIYQDPRFALFTQFQGFIATFTANHIPKLWGEYVKRGTPAMKYNAFALATTMIMMGFVSQHIKDLIKYDDEEEKKTGANPYLDTAEYLQRGVRASGLLGTGERVLDQFFPIYETRSDGLGSWVFNTSTGEAPALSYAKRAAGGVGKLIEGDVGGAARAGVKSAPFFGPFSSVADMVGEKTSKWNFNGE